MYSNLREKLSKWYNKSRDKVQSNRWSFLVSGVALMGFYGMNMHITNGFHRWLLTTPALTVIALTSLARLNDLGKEMSSLRWQVRRVGLILTGMGAITFLCIPFSQRPLYPSWIGSMIAWGFAMAWLTTPYMPPWDKYITGKAKKKGGVV